MIKIILISLLLLSCKTYFYTVRLDSQLYKMPNSDGQKLKGLIFYKKSNSLISFDSSEILQKNILGEIKKLGGNKVVPISYTDYHKSITDETKLKSSKIKIKGFIVHEIVD